MADWLSATGTEEDGRAPRAAQSQPVLMRISARQSQDNDGALYQDSLHGSPMAYTHTPLTAADAAMRWPSLRRPSVQPAGQSPQGPVLAPLGEASDSPHSSSAQHAAADAASREVDPGEAGHEYGGAQQDDQEWASNKLLYMPQLPLGRIAVLVAMFAGEACLCRRAERARRQSLSCVHSVCWLQYSVSPCADWGIMLHS